ncbi:MAG TPA: MFS transporter [Chloroflexota bacterium]|nr:MFS transporter [Chloroflexota bacterium]
MPHAPSTAPIRRTSIARLGLLWLAGMDMRLTLLAVPPVLPIIHQELQLEEKGVAALSGLPVLLFGLMAIPGALLIARIGARRALLAGIVLIGVSSALRGVGSSSVVLFAMTFCMGIGIAISQPTFSALVGQWFPHSVARATGCWSNGLLVGELLSASLTLPLVLPLVGSWEVTFAFWSAPVLLSAVLLAVGTPHLASEALTWRRGGLPNWREGRLWQLGVLQSSASLIYFGANTFIPDYLHATNQAGLVGPALAALNGGQVPASAVIALVPLRVLARRSTSIAVGVAIVVALAAVIGLPGTPTVVAAGVFGFCAAYILVLSFALPALLVGAADVPRLSAGMFAISYTLAFLVTLVAGALWDATHLAASAFLPVLASTAVVTLLGPRLCGLAQSAVVRAV